MRGSLVLRIVDTLKPCDAPLLSLQIVVLNSLLSAALPTLLTTASLTTLLPMAMRVFILLYSTTLTIALSTNQMNGTVCQMTGPEHSSMRLLPPMAG